MKAVGYCEECGLRHGIDFDPARPSAAFADWRVKHAGHAGVGFTYPERSPKPSWVTRMLAPWRFVRKWFGKRLGIGVLSAWVPVLGPPPDAIASFLHNADTKLTYANSADYAITLASLATSAGLTVGRQSTVVSNTTNLYLDYLVGGKVTTGTTPTAATSIEAWLFGSFNDTPTYPDALGASDAAWTATSADIKRAGCRLVASIPTDATSNRTYPVAACSLAAAYGNLVPKSHGVAITHSTVAALHATGSNHQMSATGCYLTTA